MGFHVNGGSVGAFLGFILWYRFLFAIHQGVDFTPDGIQDILDLGAAFLFGVPPMVDQPWFTILLIIGIVSDAILIALIYAAVNEAIPG